LDVESEETVCTLLCFTKQADFAEMAEVLADVSSKGPDVADPSSPSSLSNEMAEKSQS
jgi:hypothetical protein